MFRRWQKYLGAGDQFIAVTDNGPGSRQWSGLTNAIASCITSSPETRWDDFSTLQLDAITNRAGQRYLSIIGSKN